ncbi:hypothetical protein BD626DRAFT_563686 [Schizophyllum amplum]|uniref:Uncharacterized protein n=1 Tax=Schizophyllum amplum TaxID=97359 RepID=A0A550CYX4_9AGAR|nr:hypothetical protein BD626DRAFT_563686 [Auriculariopsis ampla]
MVENECSDPEHSACKWKTEHDRLLVENAQLKTQCQRLQDEVARYSSRFGTVDTSEDSSSISGRIRRFDCADLPPEILLLIFKRCVAPAFLISPAYSVYEEPWLECMKTKRNLSLVCRSWQQAATELLYEDIGFRSIGQLVALLDTLTTKRDLAYLVRSITVACHISSHAVSVYIGDLLSILGMCQRLRTVSFQVHGGVSQNHVSPLQIRSTTPFAHVVNLHFAEELNSLQDLWPILTTMGPRLQSLRLVLLTSSMAGVPELTFQSMTSFNLTTSWNAQSSIREVARQWLMPRVENVTFSLSVDFVNLPSTIVATAFQTFASRNGSRIRYMQLHAAYCAYNGSDMSYYSIDIQPMLRHCPLLEHLVLLANMRHPISHPTLRWIDVWEPPTSRRLSSDIWTEVDKLTKAVFPCLRGVRTIDCALSPMMDLPRVIHPEVCAGLGSAVAAFKYPGVRVKAAETRLWRADMDDFPVDDNTDDDHQCGDKDRQEVTLDEQSGELDRIHTQAEWQEADEDDLDDLDFEPGPSRPTTPVSSANSSVSSCVEADDDSEDTEEILQWTHDDVLRAFRDRNAMPVSGGFSLLKDSH